MRFSCCNIYVAIYFGSKITGRRCRHYQQKPPLKDDDNMSHWQTSRCVCINALRQCVIKKVIGFRLEVVDCFLIYFVIDLDYKNNRMFSGYSYWTKIMFIGIYWNLSFLLFHFRTRLCCKNVNILTTHEIGFENQRFSAQTKQRQVIIECYDTPAMPGD